MAGMDVTIINTMTDDYNKQNAVAVGLATGASNVELPNLPADNGPTVLNGWVHIAAGTQFSGVNKVDCWPNMIDYTTSASGVTVNKDCYFFTVSSTEIYITTDPKGYGPTGRVPSAADIAKGIPQTANIKIDASDGLSPGELYAVGRSASNTETKDQALTITPQKMDSVLKSIERDAKA